MSRLFGVGAVVVVFGSIVACGSEEQPGGRLNLPPREEPAEVAEPKEEPAAEEAPPFEPVLCSEQEASFEAKRPKSNILVLLDRSGSMQIKLPTGETRWTATRDALFKMIDGLPKADARASVMQFPQGDATVNTCCTINGSNQVDCNCTSYPAPTKRCDPATYKAPAPMDLDSTSIASIKKTVNASNTSFYWGTPLAAAEAAGVDLQKSSANDGIKSIILLTDGAPTSCDTTANPTANDPKLIVDAAKAGLTDKIRTFVIGVVDGKNGNDARPDVLEQVATAGGTTKFFSVSAANLQMELGKALDQITREATDCTFDLPTATDTTDLDKVNVTLTTSTGTETISRDQAQAEGWDFQDGQTRVKLFGAACTKLASESTASVKVVLGCKTVTSQ
jgi:hypothetical protein